MPTLSYAGWQFGPLLTDVLSEVKALTRLAAFDHIGSTQVAAYINQAVEEFLEENPALGSKSATLSLVADTSAYALSSAASDLFESHILRIEFNDTGAGDYINKLIEFRDRNGMLQLPQSWRNGTYTAPYPEIWSFDDDRSDLIFLPTPSDSTRTVKIVYRQRPTAITSGNVDTPGSTVIGEIPKRFKSLIAARVAYYVAQMIGGLDLSDVVNIYETERAVAQRRIAEVEAIYASGQKSRFAPGIIASDKVFAGLANNPRRWSTVR